MNVYSEEFKADAVALYLSDPARTYASVAKNLGVNRETLRVWVRGARLEVFRWAARYNTARRHSALGQVSPVSYEQMMDKVALAA